jgi:hypothetical protein
VVRLLSVLFVCVLSACAPRQQIVVAPELKLGTVLRYEFDARVRTDLHRDQTNSVETTLNGIIELEILELTQNGSRLEITFTPLESSRDGRATEPGPEQRREVLLRPDGSVETGSTGSAVGDSEPQPELLATLLHPRVPEMIERPGDRWEIDETEGQLVALDRDSGHDLAQMELSRVDHVQRRRILDGQPVDLTGSEKVLTELLWDLDRGFPTRALVDSIASLDVRAGALRGGKLTIRAKTSVALLDQVS